MINEPSAKQLKGIPALYTTEAIPAKDKVIYSHFRIFDSHWYVIEWDSVDTCFAFCILNGDLQMAEWGYVSLSDLKQIKVMGQFEVEFDTYWEPKPAGKVELIRRGGGIFSDTEYGPNKDPWVWHSLES